MKQYKKALFIFRRDLRLNDNTGLLFALENAQTVIPCFIFTPEQIEHNPYRSDRCLQFMIESLEDLESQLSANNGRLFLFYGKVETIITDCIKNLGVDAIIVNRDYTPYSINRDQKLTATCEALNASFHSFEDALLHPPEETLKSDGKPYTIFTPFYRNALKLEVDYPSENRHTNYESKSIPFAASNASLYNKVLPLPKRQLQSKGGRSEALKILASLGNFESYKEERDFPALEKTTHLSGHLKFTTCSPRETYWAIYHQLGESSELLRALHWRDFFSSIGFYFPRVFTGAFQQHFNAVKWSYDEQLFKKWCEGTTGFPIVDAGIREMNQTGFMHNRLRMIVASFLVKDLHFDWRWGEKYFAQKLIDYDPVINNGNWQWAASTGCDAQPYFRIFNPWLQGLKFDKDCIYIKKWVPELESYSPKIIHKWFQENHQQHAATYPAPCVGHAEESKKALAAYKAAFNNTAEMDE
ncbi:MAG: deoxyribodipyrimidine photo-lyase [Parachlamydiaceae bacterium]|nr:deoxyribodipyrimidine photo-lyase [Parachlamydiaceae bacterium]